jgi:hypothetical protein
MLLLSLGREPLVETLAFGLLAVTLGMTGALVASRQPANPIGWIFCGHGVFNSLVETWHAFAYHSLPGGTAGVWVVSWSWIGDLALFAVVFLLFPTGRRLTTRWRRVIWLLLAGCALGIPCQALSVSNTNFASGRNPLAVESIVIEIMLYVGVLGVIAGLAAAVISVVLRFRRAAGIERLQLKLFVLAGSMIVVVMMISVPFFYDSVIVQAATVVVFLAVPVAAGIAILRYRLYDIDVVINRALVYLTLTATLALCYIVLIIGSGSVLRTLTDQSSDIATAASTLAVAALFRPLRRRIQGLVDRRFYRRKYNAAHAVERLSARLRDEMSLPALSGELGAVVTETMQPAHVSLWLRPSDGARRQTVVVEGSD